MIIVDGPGGNGLGKAIAERLGCEYVLGWKEGKKLVFPDGESDVGIQKGILDGEDVFIVQTTSPEPDKRLNELYFLADQAHELGASSVSVVAPYLSYARQDKSFPEKHNAVSIHTVLKTLNALGVRRLITVAPHNEDSLKAFFHGEVIVPDVFPLLAGAINGGIRNPIVIAPDKGARRIAERVAGVLHCPYINMEKRRNRLTGSLNIARGIEIDLKGYDGVIVDDMVAKGSTVMQTSRHARHKGASNIIVVAAHLLLLNEALGKIKRAGVSRVYGTNSIPQEGVTTVDIAGIVADAIRKTVQVAPANRGTAEALSRPIAPLREAVRGSGHARPVTARVGR